MRAINKAREAELARGAVNPLLSLADAVRDGDNQLANRRALIVFVHGFCALDVGTFDLLLNRLRASPRFGAGVALAGFPHFTLLPVVENAEKLCDLFTAVTARNLPVACVAHSRGGLVVRCAAARFYELYSHDQARTRLLCGCIAFGTPHEGTPLAALPDQLVGTVVTAMQRRAARGNAGLLTLLRLYQKHKTYEGVEDLMPTAPNLGGEPQRFVDRLEAKEREVGRIRLYVIGGDMDGQPVPPEDRDYLMWRALEPHYPDGHHDWVVPMDSSAPYRFENGRQEVTCNHFDYFEDNQGQILDEAVDLLEVLIAQARDAKKAERARQPQTARE
jgi:pimeloyl-ACP methyl ester carboxylesterase